MTKPKSHEEMHKEVVAAGRATIAVLARYLRSGKMEYVAFHKKAARFYAACGKAAQYRASREDADIPRQETIEEVNASIEELEMTKRLIELELDVDSRLRHEKRMSLLSDDMKSCMLESLKTYESSLEMRLECKQMLESKDRERNLEDRVVSRSQTDI